MRRKTSVSTPNARKRCKTMTTQCFHGAGEASSWNAWIRTAIVGVNSAAAWLAGCFGASCVTDLSCYETETQTCGGRVESGLRSLGSNAFARRKAVLTLLAKAWKYSCAYDGSTIATQIRQHRTPVALQESIDVVRRFGWIQRAVLLAVATHPFIASSGI